MAHRNAASVLPLPVGASSSVDCPRLIGGHPCACAVVGAANDARNQSWIAGWNTSREASAARRERLRDIEIILRCWHDAGTATTGRCHMLDNETYNLMEAASVISKGL